jgi:REP element-mobilizing transposase RayT
MRRVYAIYQPHSDEAGVSHTAVAPTAWPCVGVAKIKGYTSHELRPPFSWLRRRLPTQWTRSKVISSVGAVTLDVQAYLANQKGV